MTNEEAQARSIKYLCIMAMAIFVTIFAGMGFSEYSKNMAVAKCVEVHSVEECKKLF